MSTNKNKNSQANYIPFGSEWEKEMMKLPKKVIIGMYRDKCLSIIKAELAQIVNRAALEKEKA